MERVLKLGLMVAVLQMMSGCDLLDKLGERDNKGHSGNGAGGSGGASGTSWNGNTGGTGGYDVYGYAAGNRGTATGGAYNLSQGGGSGVRAGAGGGYAGAAGGKANAGSTAGTAGMNTGTAGNGSCFMNLNFKGTVPLSSPTTVEATYFSVAGNPMSVELTATSGGNYPSFALEIITMAGGGITKAGTYSVGTPGVCAPACGTYTFSSSTMYESVSSSSAGTSSINITQFGKNPGERIAGSFVFYMSPNLLDSKTDGPVEGNFSCVIK